ncbi:MAG: four helix bundle protein [Deltaproteobacteria bacterium]|nr:four helix bundle protein [Deltaproteobacteria bacterium]
MKFEDLQLWKRSIQLSTNIYDELRDTNNYILNNQITRSGLSLPSNIAESFERESPNECVEFLSHAKGSCSKLRTQIYIGMHIGHIKRNVGIEWIRETNEISSVLNKLIKGKYEKTNDTASIMR